MRNAGAQYSASRFWQPATATRVIFFPVDGCRIRKLAFEEGPGKKGDMRETRDVECVST